MVEVTMMNGTSKYYLDMTLGEAITVVNFANAGGASVREAYVDVEKTQSVRINLRHVMEMKEI